MRARLLTSIAMLATSAMLTFASAAEKPAATVAPGQCAGTDMLAEAATQNPTLHQRVMSQAANIKNADGLLWKVEKEGRPASYLFGTVHLTDKRVNDLSPEVMKAIKSSKQVALEVSDLSETAIASVIAQSAPLVMYTDGRRLDGLISPDEYETVKSVMGRTGLPGDLAAMFKPWIVTMILSVSDCEREKVQKGERVLDMKIAEIGKKAGLDVVGLETIPAQIESLASVPEQQQIDMLRASLKFADRTDDMMETLVQLYLKRKIAAALPFQIAMAREAGIGDEAFAGFQQKLIVERNQKMHAVAEPLLEKGGLFVAIGALHLPGDDGFVELLRRNGYTVTKVE